MKEQPNLTYIKSMSGGDELFESKLIDIIKNEFPLEKAEYFSNFRKKDFKLTASNVHKLKHKISILGLEKSYAIAVDYENNLLEGSIDLADDFESILSCITNFLEDL